jgi:hypothetical protein
MLMRPLRSHRLTLLAAGALLASPLLGGCGFNYQTDRINTISAGVNDRSGQIDVLGAVVIAGQDDLGLFAATLVNNDLEGDATTLDKLEPTEQVSPSAGEQPVEIPAGGRVSLFQTGGIAVSGDFTAGDFVDVTLSFSTGQVTTVEVAVVTPCRQYSLDKLTELTLPTSAASTGTSTEDTSGASASTSEPTSEASSESTTGSTTESEDEVDPYSCEPAVQRDLHAEEGE